MVPILLTTSSFVLLSIKGKIINIGSIYGLISSDERIYGDSGRNNSEVYSATKAGVINLTKYMATHFGKYKQADGDAFKIGYDILRFFSAS